MKITKLFKFEGAHVVRNCSTDKCKYSIHGHSYKAAFELYSDSLDRGHMVYDFGLLKDLLAGLVDSFDHSIIFWDKDDPKYIEVVKKFSARWVSLPVNPTAEQLALVFFTMADHLLKVVHKQNGESPRLQVIAVTIHETDSGSATAEWGDLNDGIIPPIDIKKILYSEAVTLAAPRSSAYDVPEEWDEGPEQQVKE